MKTIQPCFKYSTLVLALCVSSVASASGFMLQEENAVQTGDFGAGGAAIAEDASTAWYNPAGLARLDKPQVVFAANQIWFNTEYTGTIDQSISIYSLSPAFLNTGPVPVSDVQGGTGNLIPAFHAAYPLTQNLVAGFSVTTPFGLETDYGDETNVRYETTLAKLRTIDISPSLGIKLNPKFSFGAGFDEQRLLLNFDNYVGTPALVHLPLNTSSQNAASDWAMGWHTGLLYQPTNTTRFGLAYHSKFTHHASGYSELTGPLVELTSLGQTNLYINNDAQATLYLPANTTLSAYHDLNNRWSIMGSVIYTQWDVFKQLTLNNVAGIEDTTVLPRLVPITVTIPENFRNTWRFSLGTNYKLDENILLRGGIGYDENPTNSADRNLLLPDGNRYAVAIGARCRATKNLSVDTGYTHEFIQFVGINNTMVTGPQTVVASGNSHSYANIFGLQLTYTFA